MKKSHQNNITTLILIMTLFSFSSGIVILTIYSNNRQKSTSSYAYSSLDSNCREGVYWAKSQVDGSTIKCGRAPKCGGYTYNQTDAINHVPAGKCWLHEQLGVSKCDTTCKGFVPLCCYAMEENGDIEACNWVERKYCHPSQCQKHGITQNCGDAIVTYCKDIDRCVGSASEIPYIPLSQRLPGGSTPPTNTPPPTATNTQVPPPPPTATFTPKPIIPTATPTRPPVPPPATFTPHPNQPAATATPTTLPIQPTQPGQPLPTFTTIPTQPIAKLPTTVAPTAPVPVPPTATFTPKPFFRNPFLPDPTNTPIPPHNPAPSIYDPGTVATPTQVPAPTIHWKTPKELAREVVTYERVTALNRRTKQPLNTVKTGYERVKIYDQQLERTVESWIDRLRIQILTFIQQFR